jgi:serine/threonine protein kinase/tetratricopeptide (TPR) repeat protein
MSQGTDTGRKSPSSQGGRDDSVGRILNPSHGAGRIVNPSCREKPSFIVSRSIKRKLLEELCGDGEADRPLRPEELLPRWPSSPETDPDVASLIFEDFRQRRRRGEEPSLDEYDERFPEHKDSVARLFRHQDFLRSITGASDCSGPALSLPAVGDELFGFRLRRELGTGAFARVFLAEQVDLAGRLVVLKTSDTNGDEPQTLAQLQHTHIVPIHSVHENAQAGVRAVCMPYFGGASLSRILQKLWADPNSPASGKQLVEALAAVGSDSAEREAQSAEREAQSAKREAQSAERKDILCRAPRSALSAPTCPPSHSPTVSLLSRYSYVQAASWIVARLAEGLQHAHERGVLHRDIKPSNILVGADGQPMLLDFNLAHNVNSDQAQAAATLGGTVAYMAPEHLRALATRDPELVRKVDHRSDVYALGMVLYEMLTGHNPFDQSGSYSPLPVLMEAMAVERSRNVPSLRRRRPDVPWSLESIVCKCLAPDQQQRYQKAEHLAQDLKCFLQDQPLKYAPELSRRERIRKWIRRHPRLTSSGSVAAAAALLLLAGAAAFAGVREHLTRTKEELAVSQALDRKRAYQDGSLRVLCLVNTTTDLEDHLQQGLELCEKTLGLYGVLERGEWEEDPDWRRLDPEDRRQLAEDTRELLLLLAGGRVRRAPGDKAILREALALLERAERIRGLDESPALLHDRASYLDLLGETAAARTARALAEQVRATSARDHYLLAAAYVRKGGADNYRQAIAELNEAVRRNPRHYWSYFQRGMCFKEIGDYTLAAGDFGTCIGLRPELAWAYFNRGWVLHQIGKRESAYADYTDALGRDPDFANGYMNRGLVCLEMQRFTQALADYDRTARLGRDDATLHAGRGIALEGLRRPAEADEAFERAFARLQTAPAMLRSRIRWTYGFAVAKRAPEKARQAFDLVLDENPNDPQALYGRGMLLAEQNHPEEAMHWFNQAMEAAPSFVEPRCARAILLARRGSIQEAVQDINWCLDRDRQAGAVLYAAGCVSALAAKAASDAPAAESCAQQALGLLKAALEHGYGHDQLNSDPDLAAIRDRAEFDALLRQ